MKKILFLLTVFLCLFTPLKSQVSTKNIKTTTISIIGYYDLMGQPVQHMYPNKLYIVLFSNNKRRKVYYFI